MSTVAVNFAGVVFNGGAGPRHYWLREVFPCATAACRPGGDAAAVVNVYLQVISIHCRPSLNPASLLDVPETRESSAFCSWPMRAWGCKIFAASLGWDPDFQQSPTCSSRPKANFCSQLMPRHDIKWFDLRGVPSAAPGSFAGRTGHRFGSGPARACLSADVIAIEALTWRGVAGAPWRAFHR